MRTLNGILVFFCAATVLLGQDPELVKRAEAGDADAQFNLGEAYAKGEGAHVDIVELMKWYRLAADQNHAKAQYMLGVLYAYGLGVPEDQAEAAKWYRLAAEQGYDEA
jgi:TPR repeat protein